jgi:spore coat polysaccharide biosynthesis predicted glycosyltransferase SpsG
MKVAFFTEAGLKRGMGHLIRCYTIAQKFKDNFCEVDLFLDSDIDFSYKFNDLKSFTWDNFQLQKKYDVIFIDSYEATLDIYQEASNNSKVAVFLDDKNRLNYPTGVIINFAPDANEEFFQSKQKENTYLLGLDYIPIRKEFIVSSKEKKENIFIILGGTDTEGLSCEIIELIQDINISKTLVTNSAKTKEELEKFENLKVLYQPKDNELVENMVTSSIAISTASMTLYELAYLQIPTITISVNQNQANGAKQLMQNNITHKNIDIEDYNWENKLYKELIKCIKIKNTLKVNNQIDGLGTQRIFDSISRLVQ